MISTQTEHNAAIEVVELSKVFKLYTSQKQKLLDYILPFSKSRHTPFTALEPISFTIPKGEIFGIIGKNGSGKSTLFKILASVMSPTSGTFACHGKLTALLELGAGFNRDLNGIDNLFYLGAIQGIRREAMEEKMDDIIRFAELGDYIYQPVRMYSSGMNSRLAFSMAVHIDPEILISDEILSVGDVRFQQKCHRRIREMMEMGKTILLCTHNMGAVREYCHRALWLHEGKMMALGNAREVTDEYEQFMLLNTGKNFVLKRNAKPVEINPLVHKLPDHLRSEEWIWFDENKQSETRILMGRIHNREKTIAKIAGGENVWFSFGIQSQFQKSNVSLILTINGKFSIPVLMVSNSDFDIELNLNKGDLHVITVQCTMPYLTNGKYTISAELTEKVKDNVVLLDKVLDGLSFMVEDKDESGNHKSQLRLSGANFETESFPL